MDDLLIEEIYASATEETSWATPLNRLAAMLNAPAIGLSIETRVGGLSTGLEQNWLGLEPEFERRYIDHYWKLDPLRELGRERPRGTTVHSGSFEARYLRSEFYNDLCRPFGLSHLAANVVERSDSSLIGLGAMRRDGAPPFGEADVELLKRIGPHLRRALEVSSRLTARLDAPFLPLALERLTVAGLLLDAAGRIVSINGRAQRILESKDGLGMRRDQLTFSSSEARAWFERAAFQATAASPRIGSVYRLARPSGRLPVILRVAPVRPGKALHDRARFLLLIEDAGEVSPDVRRSLADAFGLTDRETEVACLVANGLSQKEVASHLASAWNTVRFQLRMVYEKTGTRGQVELVRLVSSLEARHKSPSNQ